MTPGCAEPVKILLVQGDRDEGDRDEGDPRERDLADRDSLPEQLLADRFAVRIARSAGHARSLARASPPDLVLIRARHPLCAALDLVVEIRRGAPPAVGDDAGARANRGPTRQRRDSSRHPWSARLPVIVVVPRRSRIDVLRVFEAGADDCMTAPLFYLELRARIRALLERRRRDLAPPIVRAGPLTIDTASRTVTLDGRGSRSLPPLQYELLLALAREPQRVIARAELTRCLWGAEPPGSTRTLDSHASRLRRALRAGRGERWIVGIRGVGYRLR